MKKTMLWGALFTLACAQIQAEVTQQPTQSQTPGSAAATSVTIDKTNQAPVVNQTSPTQGTQQNQPLMQVQPITQQPAQQIPTIQPQAAPIINCDYKISAETKTIEQSIVVTWSEKATTQAFDFDPTALDSQIQKLKPCFTDQGWVGFNLALQKSGNLEAIKSQKLTVSSQVDGQPQVTEAKNNQWKITLPLQVVYQNDKEKVTQLLSVNLTVGRKITGELGIVQLIASPRTAVASQQSNNPTAPNAATDTNKQALPPQTTNTSTTPANTTPPTTPFNANTAPAPTGNPIINQQKPLTSPPSTNTPGSPH